MAALTECASCLIGCGVLVYETTGAGAFVPSLRPSIGVCATRRPALQWKHVYRLIYREAAEVAISGLCQYVQSTVCRTAQYVNCPVRLVGEL